MRNAHGYVIAEGDRPLEADTITCHHCNRIAVVKPGPDPGTGFCRSCMEHICGPCADKGCDVFEKKLERAESRARFFRSVGL